MWCVKLILRNGIIGKSPQFSVETDELHLAQFETFVDEVLDELMKCVLIRQL